MNPAPVIFLFVLLMTGLTMGVYASLASYPPAVPAALHASRNLVLIGETAGFVLMVLVMGFLLFAANHGLASVGSLLALALVFAASGYAIFYLVSTPGLLF